MTISINQQVDYLWKKLGYGVAKTAIPTVKDATNESIISAPFLPGDRIWTQSELIPLVLPVTSGGVVEVYGQSTAIKCVMDITATPNRTWLTTFTDWIPVEYGSTYQVKVFLAPSTSLNPQIDGTQLYAAGTNNDDEWFFDYEAGVVHFVGNNLPALTFDNNTIFVCGGRYVGNKGLGNLTTGTFGNLTISGYTISSTANIILNPLGNVLVNGSVIGNVGYPSLPTDAATVSYVTNSIANLQPNAIWQGDSSVFLVDTPISNGGLLTVNIDGTSISTFSNTSATLANVTISNSTISSVGSLVLSPALGNVVEVDANTALQVPVGTTAERPTTPARGYLRFNTTSGILECFDGTSWVGAQSQVSSQIIYGDGTTTTFTLVLSSHATNIIVTTNGVVQLPNVAYAVMQNQLTFAEAPLPSETIEVRFISQSVSTIATVAPINVVDSTDIIVDQTETVVDSFPFGVYKSAKYTLSVTYADKNAQLIDVLLVHNGELGSDYSTINVTHTAVGTPVTAGSNSLVMNSFAWGNNCILSAVSSDSNTKVKVLKTYFAI